jgi:D-3-phosphoglycerate dehydrogenase / 2-oxoglutarate reductase
VQLTDDLNDGVIQCSLERVLADSDVVSLHPRVTAETTKMINKETLSQMKKGAYFINTARGPLVNYDDLYEALVSGTFAARCSRPSTSSRYRRTTASSSFRT